jgi:hypothetical protein
MDQYRSSSAGSSGGSAEDRYNRPLGGFTPSSPDYRPLSPPPAPGPSRPLGQGYVPPTAPTQPNFPPPPPPAPGYGPPPGYPPGYAQAAPGYPPVMVVQRRDTTPVVVEVICAIFGIYGVGWLMAGETTTGVLLLVGGLFWAAVVATGTFFTAGLGVCCFVPLHAAFIALSAVMLSNHIKRMP